MYYLCVAYTLGARPGRARGILGGEPFDPSILLREQKSGPKPAGLSCCFSPLLSFPRHQNDETILPRVVEQVVEARGVQCCVLECLPCVVPFYSTTTIVRNCLKPEAKASVTI